VKPWNG
jgi:WD40 repeat protein